jgi:hypothetical protein
MKQGLKRFKPGVTRRVHLGCTAGLWTAIGIFLSVRGIILLKSGNGLWLIVVGLLLGSAKSFIILDRSALRGIDRISRFADNTCIGAVYSWKVWLLVLGMMMMGIILRNLSLSPLLVGTMCVAIGWALVFSSRYAWKSWVTWEQGF